MVIDTFNHIEHLSNELSSLIWFCHYSKGRNMHECLKKEFSALIRKPFSTDSKIYCSFTSRLDTIKKKLKNALEHVEAITDNVQIRLNDSDNNPKAHEGVYSLPPEILSEIFKYGYDEDDYEQHFPFNVSQVSKRFRAVAMHTPMLWSNLWPDFQWYQLSLFIERSKSAGLTIHIDAKCRHITKYLSIITEHCNRWSKVIFDYRDFDTSITDHMHEYLFRMRFMPTDLVLPRLVEIKFRSFLLVDTDELPFHAWHVPNLKRFYGTCLHIPNNLRTVTDCTLRLSSLGLNVEQEVNASQLVQLFRNFPACISLNLCVLDIRMHHPFFDACKKNRFTNRLPNLRHLTVDTEVSILQYLFDTCIATQDLKSISITVDNDSLSDLSDLMSAHPFDSLESIHINFENEGTFLLDTLHFPSLKHVEIHSEMAQTPLAFNNIEYALHNLSSITFYRCYELDSNYIGNIIDTWTAGCCSLRAMHCRLPKRLINRAENKLTWRFDSSKALRRSIYGYDSD